MTAIAKAAPLVGGRWVFYLVAAVIAVVELRWLFDFGMGFGADSWGYARAWDNGLYEPGAMVGQATFLYSPVFAQAIWPLTLLPSTVFVALVMIAAALTYAYLLWPLPFAVLSRSQTQAGAFWFPEVPWQGRLIAGGLLVMWGARTDRRWTIPLALVLAQPGWMPWTYAILAAVPRLRSEQTGREM